jgi:hypothetical protein
MGVRQEEVPRDRRPFLLSYPGSLIFFAMKDFYPVKRGLIRDTTGYVASLAGFFGSVSPAWQRMTSDLQAVS